MNQPTGGRQTLDILSDDPTNANPGFRPQVVMVPGQRGNQKGSSLSFENGGFSVAAAADEQQNPATWQPSGQRRKAVQLAPRGGRRSSSNPQQQLSPQQQQMQMQMQQQQQGQVQTSNNASEQFQQQGRAESEQWWDAERIAQQHRSNPVAAKAAADAAAMGKGFGAGK